MQTVVISRSRIIRPGCLLVCGLLFLVYCHKSPVDPEAENSGPHRRPQIWMSSPLLPTLSGNHLGMGIVILDLHPGEEASADTETHAVVTTSLGDRETVRMVPWDWTEYVVYDKPTVVYGWSFQEEDGILQVPPRSRGGWVLIRYKSAVNGNYYDFKYEWTIE